MNYRLPHTLLLLCPLIVNSQAFVIDDMGLDDLGRFEITATVESDTVLRMNRFDDDELSLPTLTTVGMALAQSGQSIRFAEDSASGSPVGFFRIDGTDLATDESDTDGDGIKDRTELQARPFVFATDGTDSGNVDVFDITTTATISDGIPGAGAGNIENAHHADIYRFDGTAGTGIFIDVTSHQSGLTFNDYKLIDPYGNVVKSSRFGLSEIGPVTLPYDGEYILLVGDADDDGVGTYSFTISVIPAPQSFSIAIGDTISDGIPSAGAGNLELAGAYDLYTFEGTAGQSIFVNILSSSGLTFVDYRLIAPDGTEVDYSAFGLSEIATVELPQTGTYTFEVGEATSAKTGTYSFQITDIPAPDSFAIAIGGTVSDGVPGVGAGNIESPGVFDEYTFNGVAGQTIFFNVLSNTGLTFVDYKLIAPDDSVVASSGFGLGEIATVELPLTGIYTVEVGEAVSDKTGTYSFQITNIPAPNSFAIAIGDTVSDGIPGAGAGNIESPGVFDEYTFNGVAGQTIFFNVLSNTGLTFVDYKLIAPDDSVVASSGFGFSEIATAELPLTGTYIVQVGEAVRDNTGTYSFQITDIPAPNSFAIAIGDTVSDGVPGAGAGNIESPGVFDEYSFTGVAGQTIFVDKLSFSGVNSVNYRIIAPDDSELASRAFNQNDMASIELPQDGTYTLEVGEATNDAIGTYSIAITNVPAPDSFAISIGDTVSNGVPGTGAGNIETPGVFDEYTFTGVAGQTIFVDKLSFSGVNSVNYRIIAPDDSELASRAFNQNDMASIELPQDGTYTLEVGEATNDAIGTYSIAITNVPAPDSFAISIGDTVSDGVPGAGAGNIETPGAYDEYTFAGTAGDWVFVDLLSFTDLGSMNYRLIAPDDSEIDDKQMNSGDIGAVQLPSTGTYTLEVGEANNDAIGTYSIAVNPHTP